VLGMGSENVLKKLLRPKTQEQILGEFLRPQLRDKAVLTKRRGRPKLEKSKKARNFTLCLAPQFVDFIDKMVVKDPKVKGRGRKIRFIVERFIEHEKRSLAQMRVLRESLGRVQEVLSSFSGRVRKGEKLELTSKERALVSKAVDQVHLLMKILYYTPKVLQRMLPKEEWAILSFCLDWKNNRGVVL
jgi:hypothetical protein